MTAADLAQRLPSKPPADDETVAEILTNQTALIELLRTELRQANSWQSKWKDYLIGGVVGTILGLLATLLVK